MKEIIKIIFKTINVISFGLVILIFVIGVIYEIIGRTKFEQMLSSIGLSNGSKSVWIVGTIALIFLITTYYIEYRFFDK